LRRSASAANLPATPSRQIRNAAVDPLGISVDSADAVRNARPSLLADDRASLVVLPTDHPAWRRDAISLSARAAALLARLRPYVIRVLTFWDHSISSAVIDDRFVEVDGSGSYRAR